VNRARPIILLAFLAASPAAARAADPAPQSPTTDKDETETDTSEAEPPAEEAKPVEAAARIPIAGYDMTGPRIDPDDQLMALLVSITPVGEPFVESGPSDRIGKPIGTIPRIVEALDSIGYRATVTKRPAGNGVILNVDFLPYDRLRYVFVTGNGAFIRQDEVQRRITVRPGRPLPPAGPQRTAALEQERARILDFLRTEGYFEATVRL
jgi:hypothetical protein